MSNKPMRLKLLLFLSHRKSPVPHSGLSLLEVLVASLIVFFTIMGALNGMLYALVFQVKAERQAQATYWIQQDLEAVKAGAANYTNTSGCASSTIATNFNSSANMPAIVGSNPKKLLGKNYRLVRVVNPSGNVLQITYRVGENYVAGTGQNDANSDLIADSDIYLLATLYTEVMPASALSCT